MRWIVKHTILKFVGVLVPATILLHLTGSILWWVLWNLTTGQISDLNRIILSLLLSVIAFAIAVLLQLRRAAWSLICLGVLVFFVPWVLNVLIDYTHGARARGFFEFAFASGVVFSVSATFLLWKMIPRDLTSLAILIAAVGFNPVFSAFRILPGASWEYNSTGVIIDGIIIGFLVLRWLKVGKGKEEEIATVSEKEKTSEEGPSKNTASHEQLVFSGKVNVVGEFRAGRLERYDSGGNRLPPIPLRFPPSVAAKGLSLNEGDQIRVLGKWKRHQYVKAKFIQNLTTGATAHSTNWGRAIRVFATIALSLIFVWGLAVLLIVIQRHRPR